MKKRIYAVFLSALVFPLYFPLTACKETKKSGTEYDITAAYDPTSGVLTASETVKIVNTSENEWTTLQFFLPPNAYREDAVHPAVAPNYVPVAYGEEKTYGKITVSEVDGVKNYAVCGEDANVLEAELTKSLFPGESATLTVDFTTELAFVRHRLGVGEHTVNLSNFYPILSYYGLDGFDTPVYSSIGDPFLSECADYTLRLTLPKEYEMVSTGDTVGTTTKDGQKTVVASQENVRDFAVVLYKDAQRESCFVGKTKLNYFYYADETPVAHLAVVRQAFELFEKDFGKYPYAEYNVCQTGFCYGGMEYPKLVYISDTLTEEELVHTLVHETAHQWWYGVVGSNQIDNAWQDEGLCEYSTALFYEAYPNIGMSRKEFMSAVNQEYRSYFDVYSRVFAIANTKMTRPLCEYISEYEYKAIAYDKGAILFDEFEKSVGKKRFLAGLKRYYRECGYKVATEEDLIGAFELSGMDADGFFRAFLSGEAIV